MPKHSTSSPMPTRMAITLKNARAFRAAATFRMGRTCSDIRCLSCFAKGSGRVLVVVLVIILVVVVNHPPPHVRSEQGEGPPLQGISRVEPCEPAAHHWRRRHQLDRRRRGSLSLIHISEPTRR